MTPSRRAIVPILLALLALVMPTVAAALQPEQTGPVSVRAAAQRSKVKPGERAIIAVELAHAPKFHTWPAKHEKLPATVDSFAIRTEIALTDTAPTWAKPLGIQWPQTHPGEVPNLETGKGTMTVPLYSDKAVAYLTIEVAADAPAGAATIPVQVNYQACDDKSCQMPEEPVVEVALTIAPDAPAAADREASLFAGYKAGEIGQAIGAPSVAAPNTGPVSPTVADRTLFGINLGSGLLLLFLAAVAGGAILNLTPCVLPIIPLKIMALVHHAGSPGRRIMLGLWMTIGVVAFWSALAIPVLALRSTGSGDPSQLIFGTWWLTLSIGMLIAAMGLGIMGLFTIQLPQSVYAINPKADTAWGSFMYGVMAGVLGLPCFGFVAGGLLAGLIAMPWEMVVTVFVGLGVGMGAPYLVLSIWPALVAKIPRTGPASELVKQVMGLLLIAFAGFFVSAGIKAALAEMPYLSESIAFWIVAFFVVLTALWLTARTLQISRRFWPKVVMPTLAIVSAAAVVAWIGRGTASDREDWLHAAAAGDGQVVSGAWLKYTPERFEKALDSGKVVVADFTADWCISCKFFKRTVLDVEPLRSRLRQEDVILLEVDCTVKVTSPGAKFLASLGLTGVPQLAFWAPGDKQPMVVHTAYTSGVVLDSIDAAKRKGEVAKGGDRGPKVTETHSQPQ